MATSTIAARHIHRAIDWKPVRTHTTSNASRMFENCQGFQIRLTIRCFVLRRTEGYSAQNCLRSIRTKWSPRRERATCINIKALSQGFSILVRKRISLWSPIFLYTFPNIQTSSEGNHLTTHLFLSRSEAQIDSNQMSKSIDGRIFSRQHTPPHSKLPRAAKWDMWIMRPYYKIRPGWNYNIS